LNNWNDLAQKEVLDAFKAGECNVLVCTSIAEEGLDIGQVDLIVMFDVFISHTRLVCLGDMKQSAPKNLS
jgi:ERCC4-related helicase